jgi:transcriptional antiterminator
MEVSVRTIQRYLNELQLILEELTIDLELSIQPGVGVSLVGDLNKVQLLVNQLKTYQVDEMEDRTMYICLHLLEADSPITIQSLADDLYVSRSTIDNTLKEVRKKMTTFDLKLKSSNKGLELVGSEKQKRHLMADILKYFWGGLTASQSQPNKQWEFNVFLSEQAKEMIDSKTIKQVMKVLQQLIDNVQLQLTDYEYQSFILHITIMIERIRLNQSLDTKENTPKDLLSISKKLIRLLEEAFHLNIPKSERTYINNYMKTFNRQEKDFNSQKSIDSFKYGKEIQLIISTSLGVLKPDELLINHLIQHLNSAIERLKLEASIRNPYLVQIKQSFPRAFSLGVSLAEALEKYFNIDVNEDEIAYIAIHIQSFLERRQEDKQAVILVCASGFGTAKLLEQRLLQSFDDLIEIKKIVGIREMNTLQLGDELVISTIPIENYSKQVITVNPLLNEQDMKQIQNYLTSNNESIAEQFWNLVNEESVFIGKGKHDTKDAVLTTMTTRLIQRDEASIGILESVHARENLASTAMRNFAMPHGDTKYIRKTGISIYLNPHGIQWGEDVVNFVFFFAINPNDTPKLKNIYKYFSYLIDQPHLLDEMLSMRTSKEFIEKMKGR